MNAFQHEPDIKLNRAPNTAIPRLELLNICKNYNSLKANDNINLKVQSRTYSRNIG